MAKKVKHEDHLNHEAWAIPYGDLLTLLLAFFVVMYAISSLNEGKYRVLSDTLSRAFGGPPKSMRPVQIGQKPQQESPSTQRPPLFRSEAVAVTIGGTMRDLQNPQVIAGKIRTPVPQQQVNESGNTGYAANKERMLKLKSDIEKALAPMIEKDLVAVRRTELWLEVEIKADILFPSGIARLSPGAEPILRELARVLQPFPNSIRVEGYTDNVPIHTAQFPSNWELSSARASSVVHEFISIGIAPQRLSVLGFGEYRPVADNAAADGRTKNRRVLIVILADPEATRDWLRRQADLPAGSAGTVSPLADGAATEAAVTAAGGAP